jgi:hypothetical protein
VRAFRRDGDALVAEVEPGEREVLATVVADVAELLGGGRLEERSRATDEEAASIGLRLRLDPLPAPDDPAVHRLLPDASRDDADVAAEFRRLTEDDLRQQKIDRLADLFDRLTADEAPPGEDGDADAHDAPHDAPRRHRARGRHASATVVRVPKDRAPALAATLTDIRLVLGERLGVTDEQESERLEHDVVGADPDADDRAAQARQYLGSVFLALGWWQETLMACLLADLPDVPEGGGSGSGRGRR